MSELYPEELLEIARHPHRFGQMPDPDQVKTGLNASCGDDMTVYLKLSADRQQVVDILWSGQGCAISQAAMSVVADLAVGKTWTEIEQITQAEILAELGLTEISPGRLKCLLLGISTLTREV